MFFSSYALWMGWLRNAIPIAFIAFFLTISGSGNSHIQVNNLENEISSGLQSESTPHSELGQGQAVDEIEFIDIPKEVMPGQSLPLDGFDALAGFVTTPPLSIPSGFNLIRSDIGVGLYKKDYAGGQPDYVQVAVLSAGARVKLLHGSIADMRPGQGPYGGNNATFWKTSLATAWDGFYSEYSHSFCITNGQFFSTTANPTPLAFPLKKDGQILSDGYGSGSEFPGQLLILEIWNNHLNIRELTRDNLYGSSAPDILGGLTEDADKGITNYVGRTFAGIDDTDGNGEYETIYIFNSTYASQTGAAAVLRSFGADKIIMFDGGGSTQMRCGSTNYISSSRAIPQTVGVVAGSENQPTCPVTSGKVILFDDPNCGGSSVTADGIGLWNLVQSFNDRAESIAIPAGWSARLFLHDSESSPSKCYGSTNADLWNNQFSDGTVVANETTWMRVFDNGNCEPPEQDNDPPVTSLTLSGISGDNGWFIGKVTASFTATDEKTGIASTHCNLNSTGWQTYTSPVAITTSGQNTLEYYSIDNAGNAESVKVATPIYIDTLSPVNPTSVNPGCGAVSGEWQNACSDPNFSWSGASDDTSGLSLYQYYWGPDPFGTTGTTTSDSLYDPPPVTDGTYHLRIATKDVAGNWSDWQTLFTLRYDHTVPTGSLAIKNNWSVTDQALVILNMNATDSASGVGLMRLRDGGGSWTEWKAYSPSAQWVLPPLTGQTHSVEVQYKDLAGNTSPTFVDTILFDIYPDHPSSPNFHLYKSTFGVSATNAESTSYHLTGTLGQLSATGYSQSPAYRITSGYWSWINKFVIWVKNYLPVIAK